MLYEQHCSGIYLHADHVVPVGMYRATARYFRELEG
jgi:hypothetical protein